MVLALVLNYSLRIAAMFWTAFLWQSCINGINGQARAISDGSCPCSKELCAPDGNCNKVNIALGKQASMSSRFVSGGVITGPASLAVNGDIRSVDGNCVHTMGILDSIKDWWKVDLGRDYTVTDITVYHRLGGSARHPHSQRISGIWIFVDDILCYKFPDSRAIGVHPQDHDDVSCIKPIKGRTVLFSKEDNFHMDHYSFINFCEVQVWVCRSGLYGEACQHNCSDRCQNHDCDNWDGTCLSVCADGYYGQECEPCGQCRDGTPCDKDTGLCPGDCEPCHLYQSALCKQRITTTPETTSTITTPITTIITTPTPVGNSTVSISTPTCPTTDIISNVYNSTQSCPAGKHTDVEMAILAVSMVVLGLAMGIAAFTLYDRFCSRSTVIGCRGHL